MSSRSLSSLSLDFVRHNNCACNRKVGEKQGCAKKVSETFCIKFIKLGFCRWDMAESEQESYSKANYNISYFMENYLNFYPRKHDQMQVLDALKQGAKRVLICKGRRWGGTDLTSAIGLTLSAQNAGFRTGVFGPGWDELDIWFGDHLYPHLERSRIQGSIVEELKRSIKFSNGSKIIGKICSPTSHGKRGRGFDLLIFTEAAFIMDTEMHIVRLGKLDNPNAIEIQESSPNGMNHFNTSFNDPDFVSFQFPSILNPKVSKTELAKERGKMTKLEASQELDAEFIDDSTAPFPQKLIDLAIETSGIEDWWQEKQKDGYYIAGLDLGRKRDKSVLFIWKVEKDGNLQGVLIKQHDYDPDDPRFWSKVIDSAEYLCKQFKVQILNVDCTGLGDKVVIDMKTQFADNGILTRVNGFNFTYASKNKWEGLMNQFSLKFERYKVHFPFDMEFVKQLKLIRFNSEKALFESIGKSPDRVMAAALGALATPMMSGISYSKSNEPEKELPGSEEQTVVSYAGIT